MRSIICRTQPRVFRANGYPVYGKVSGRIASLSRSGWAAPDMHEHGYTAAGFIATQDQRWAVNSLRLGDAYMLQRTWSSLVRVIACRRTGDKPLREPIMTYCQFNPWEQTLLKLESKYENAFESVVCNMAAIFSWPQCVNYLIRVAVNWRSWFHAGIVMMIQTAANGKYKLYRYVTYV